MRPDDAWPVGATISIPLVLGIGGAAALLASLAFPADQAQILAPTIAGVVVFVVFVLLLQRRVGEGLFGEVGFIYLSLALAYTVIPAFTFVVLDLDLASGFVWENLSLLLPARRELGAHLWRHALFLSGVAAGYLFARGREVPGRGGDEDPEGKDVRTIAFTIGLVLFCITTLAVLSAPIATYLDYYTRFDHLGWLPLRLAYVCLALKVGGYFVLFTFVFRQRPLNRLLIAVTVIGACAYEIVYSFGSRIEAATILLGVVCLVHLKVRAITLRQGAIAFVLVAVLFSTVEVFRSSGYDVSTARDVATQEGVTPATEFGAVYFTAFHLYSERSQGGLPRREWPMFFSDVIAVIPFIDHTRWNPQYWYAEHYFPEAVVPPQTMGPIADSAIWGGEWDLAVRSLVNGALFAYLMRWFVRRQAKWWAQVVYVYCYATSVMTLKYSVLYHLSPLLRVVLPTILLVGVVRRLLPERRDEVSGAAALEHRPA